MARALAIRLDMPDPGDATALTRSFAAGVIVPHELRAVLIKTPGNGLTNDFSRDLAVRSVAAGLHNVTDARPMLLASGGIEGIAVPHMLVLGRRETSEVANGRRLAVGFARGQTLALDMTGTAGMARAVAATVAAAMADAGITADGVVLAVVKAPLPPPPAFAGDHPALKSRARAASALGVMHALGELDGPALAEASIGCDPELFTCRALVAAGTDIAAPEVLVLGMSDRWSGDLVAASGALADMLDVTGLNAVLGAAGIHGPTQADRIAAILAKGAMPKLLRGMRPSALDDDDIHPNRHWRAAMSGVIGAVTGDIRPFLSGGGEHQGPPGGVTVAVIAHTEQGA